MQTPQPATGAPSPQTPAPCSPLRTVRTDRVVASAPRAPEEELRRPGGQRVRDRQRRYRLHLKARRRRRRYSVRSSVGVPAADRSPIAPRSSSSPHVVYVRTDSPSAQRGAPPPSMPYTREQVPRRHLPGPTGKIGRRPVGMGAQSPRATSAPTFIRLLFDSSASSGIWSRSSMSTAPASRQWITSCRSVRRLPRSLLTNSTSRPRR